MMKCDDCQRPAQWVMLWVKRFEHTEAEKKKKLIPKGPEFTVAGRFCGEHKNKVEQTPCEMERVFRFAGAVIAV